MHEKTNGYEVEQHPLVSRLLKGAFNQRPPRPRYEVTWDVSIVLNYIESLGESDSLSLQILTWKLAMILALTRPSRSADLVMLDLDTLRKGWCFRRQVWQNSPDRESQEQSSSSQLFLATADSTHNRLCRHMSERQPFRTGGSEEQTRLFLAVVRPHKPVCSSTLARWLRSLLDKACRY